ncbi:hypothetical protein O5O45_26445 [Hahella aquimaris]|uniref:hypothetical protein n=1 Tax=Hahella sp. HNIBRBA332 TaxID=3015983 RepID=UPI00273B3FE9|nr:hypothetical protein [Hahella sp. HNIBRBA332]WLQ13271.1 hypothetical protein O5O45_26445 [Hahella sp. HNIBRBA332]
MSVDDGENGVVASHGRLLAARKLGMVDVPIIELAHLSPTQKRAYILADNQLTLKAGWDEQLLRVELEARVDTGAVIAIKATYGKLRSRRKTICTPP